MKLSYINLQLNYFKRKVILKTHHFLIINTWYDYALGVQYTYCNCIVEIPYNGGGWVPDLSLPNFTINDTAPVASNMPQWEYLQEKPDLSP